MLIANSSTHQGSDVLYLDYGASNHMIGRRDLFTELDQKVQGEISIGDLSKVPV